MTFSPAILAQQLRAFLKIAGQPRRHVVAFSGGLDSTALLHALAALRASESAVPLLAVHIDHGLQADSRAWRDHCEQVAAEFAVDFRSLSVTVDTDTGSGPEASARDARYAALRTVLEDGDWLLSAHHRDDQAETLLLNLIRGSGPAGVAGIGDVRRFGPGWLLRPLLNVDRDTIEAYASL
ncbi:MAG: tRNA lysidine(34) synthetase TilS, partial [Gammaproteobacteria bacterium]|nr:tRNA lysidine(34) synthetase TilS [Gammaproteobacteria bacterium]